MRKSIIILLFLISSSLFSQIEIKLYNPYIKLGEETTLTVTIKGDLNDLKYTDPVNILMKPYGQSSSYSFINGKRSKSLIVNYKITPQAAGNIKLPIFSGVNKDNQTIYSEELTLYVEKPEVKENPRNLENTEFENPYIKLYLTLPSRDIYVGESVEVEISTYLPYGYDYDIQSSRNPYISSGSFTIDLEDNFIGKDSNYYIDGKRYHELIWRGYLTPLKAGETVLDIKTETIMSLPDKSTGFYKLESIETSIKDKVIDVKKLPLKGKPKNFSGAIGSFNINSQLNPLSARVGEPLTLTIDIFGKGNFNRIEIPKLSEDKDNWKLYPETFEFSGTNGSNFHGVKKFQQILTPKSDVIKKLPPFVFNYFDPIEKKYKTLTTSEYELEISMGAEYRDTEKVLEEDFKSDIPALKHETSRTVNDFKKLFNIPSITILLIISIVLIILSITINILQSIRNSSSENINKVKKELLQAVNSDISKGDYNGALFRYREFIIDYISKSKGINPLSITSEDLLYNPILYNLIKKSEELTYSKTSLIKSELLELTENVLEEIK